MTSSPRHRTTRYAWKARGSVAACPIARARSLTVASTDLKSGDPRPSGHGVARMAANTSAENASELAVAYAPASAAILPTGSCRTPTATHQIAARTATTAKTDAETAATREARTVRYCAGRL